MTKNDLIFRKQRYLMNTFFIAGVKTVYKAAFNFSGCAVNTKILSSSYSESVNPTHVWYEPLQAGLLYGSQLAKMKKYIPNMSLP